jgi:uncharacterized RDD family membrane protein YckC
MSPSTPGVAEALQGRRAGVVSRFLADAVDFGVILAIVLAGYLVKVVIRFMLSPRTFTWPAPRPLLMFWIGWIVLVFYLASAWSGTGRTLGKQLLGLRVVDHRGERLRFGVALLRALFCAALPFTLFWCAISSANRDVADIILRTSVVYDWRIRVQPVERVQVPAA